MINIATLSSELPWDVLHYYIQREKNRNKLEAKHLIHEYTHSEEQNFPLITEKKMVQNKILNRTQFLSEVNDSLVSMMCVWLFFFLITGC